MSQGKRMKQGKEPKRKMTSEEIAIKKKKIKRRFFILLILIVIIIAGFIVSDYIIFDSNEKTNLVINNKNITSNMKHDVLIENDTIYISKEDIARFFDKYIYLDKDTNQIITTYDKKIAAIGFEQNNITINGSNKKIYAHAIEKDGTTYLPISEMKDVYGIEIENLKDTKVVAIDSTNREQKKAMVSKDAAVKSSTGFISKTLDRVNKNEYVIVIDKTEDGWTKIRTPRGKLGYVKNDVIVNEVTIRENMTDEPQIQGKVDMFWDFFSQYKSAPNREGEKYEGVNVVSPSFFYIDGKGNFKENVGEKGKAYIDWAHGNGYKVWAMVSNSFEEDMIDTTSAIMNSYEKRQALIEEIVNVCVEYKLDGVNIDFENMKKEDKDMFSRFIIELTPRIKEMGLVTSVDVTAPDGGDTWSLCFDRNVIGNVADYIVFMAYDEYGVGSKKAGTTAGYNWVELNLKKFLQTEEIESSKIILAMPFYTRVWTEKGEELSSNIVNMKDVGNVIPNGTQKQWLEEEKQNYAEYQEKGNTKKIWIEDLDSIKAKLSLVNEYKLGGVSAWSKDRELEEVWSVIAKELEK